MIGSNAAAPRGVLARLVTRWREWTGAADAGIVAGMDETLPVLWTLAEVGRCVGLSRQRMHAIVKAGGGPPAAFRIHWHDDDWAALYQPDEVRAWARSTGRKIAY